MTINIKTLIVSTLFAVLAASAASAMTKAECKAAGGTWERVNLIAGRCTIKISPELTGLNGQGSPEITKAECEKAGGKVSADGKNCIIDTKGLAKTEVPRQTN